MLGRNASKKKRVAGFGQREERSPFFVAKLHAAQWLGILAAFVVLVVAVTKLPEQQAFISEEAIDSQNVADREYRAAFYFETPDLAETRKSQQAAVANEPAYYRVDNDRVTAQVEAVRERMAAIEAHQGAVSEAILKALRASNSAQSAQEVVGTAVQQYSAQLAEKKKDADLPEAVQLALWLSPDPDSIPERQFQAPQEGDATENTTYPVVAFATEPPAPIRYSRAVQLRDISLEALRYTMAQGIRSPNTASTERNKNIVLLSEVKQENANEEGVQQLSDLPGLPESKEALNQRLTDAIKRAGREEWAQLHEAALALTAPALVDTVRYDVVATEDARARARQAVEPVMKSFEAGENIQDRHKRWSAQSRSDVKTYLTILANEERPMERLYSQLAAHIILVILALIFLVKSIGVLSRNLPEENSIKYLNLALLMITVTLVASRIASYFEPSGYLLPVAAVGILYAILVNIRLAAIVSLLTAMLISAQYNYEWRLLLVHASMSMAGAFSIIHVRRRSDMSAASLKATLTGMLVTIAVILATDSLFTELSVRRLVLVVLNGGLCLMIVPGILSPLERLFSITTDIQLLEYSDLNNELMSQLAIEAPATYAHSLMLGQLAEAASEAIGANGLLARVCAYYHDVGKMIRSEYFTENQTDVNVHEELSPRMSARAIASHVVQGVQLGREHHLPQPILDGILEHHGTCKIGFFFEQAMESNKHGDVQEEDFRYPGPKPQRPETAILMICDAVESGVRSLRTPTEERVREFIDKIIAARSADRQFDECDLTLRQLDTIAKVLANRMTSMLHTRVAYPDLKPEGKAGNVIPMAGGGD